MSVPGRHFVAASLCLAGTHMAQDNTPVGPTVPSRPSKFMIAILAAVVVGFFAIIFTQGEATMEAEKKGSAPSTAATQPAN